MARRHFHERVGEIWLDICPYKRVRYFATTSQKMASGKNYPLATSLLRYNQIEYAGDVQELM